MMTATASSTTLDARERVRGTGKMIAMKMKMKMTRVATRTTTPRAFFGARGDEGTVGEIALADVSRGKKIGRAEDCLLYTSPSPRDRQKSRMPSSA